MKIRSVFAMAALGALVAAGCSDSDLTGINSDCSNLLGVYRATTATATGTSNGQTVNLLADGGSFDLTFGQNTFSSSYRSSANGAAVVQSGSLARATSDNIQIAGFTLFPGSATSNSFACSLDGETLTLTADASSYQFSGETAASPARLRLVLKRQAQ